MLLTKCLAAFVLICLPVLGVSKSDPMRPPEFSLPSNNKQINTASPLKLQMILMSSDRNVAVINNKTVMEGAFVLGAKIISINSNHVVVKRKGKGVDLHLYTIKNTKGLAR